MAKSNATGFRTVSIRLNVGATIIAGTESPAVNGDDTTLSVATIYDLAATDYVQLYVYQNSGGALNVNAAGNYSPEFGMVRLSN